jgi:hypothetical protein
LPPGGEAGRKSRILNLPSGRTSHFHIRQEKFRWLSFHIM